MLMNRATISSIVRDENRATCMACASRAFIERRFVCTEDGEGIQAHAHSGACAKAKLRSPPDDVIGTPFANTIACRSGINCTLCRQPEGGREWRREQKKKHPTPNGVLDFPCPHGKGWHGKGSLPNDGKRHFILTNRQGAGDAIVFSGAIRDLHLAYPGVYSTAVRAGRMELFQHNPHVLPEAKVAGSVKTIKVTPPEYHKATGHMAGEFRAKMGRALGVDVPLLSPAGDVHLTDDERTAPSEIAGPYWLLFAGGKHDFTVKWWTPQHYQRVIDALRGRVQFVRVGAGGWQPELDGVIDLRGQTNHRRLVRLMYHAQGGIGPVSYGMHLSAAIPRPDGSVRPYVVLAGGSETPAFYAYLGHTALHTIGALPCCETKGCWKFKAEYRDTNCASSDCAAPVAVADDLLIARCMTTVTPERVIEAVEQAIASPPAVPTTASVIEAELTKWRETHTPPVDPKWQEKGPRKWRELHARPFSPAFTGDDTAWMDGFTKGLPCGDCRRHWRALLASMPPDYSTPDAYHAWTVAAHNAVNRRLGKPEWTVAKARLQERAA